MSFILDLRNLLIQTGCCIASKGAKMAMLQSQGVFCDDTELKYQIRAQQMLQNWYPEGFEIVTFKPSVYIFGYMNNFFPSNYTLTVPDGYGTSITLWSGIAGSASTIVTFINANTDTTGFSAEIHLYPGLDGGYIWLFAPCGYEGLSPAGTLISTSMLESLVLTTYGFQEGCCEKIALKPCLTQEQVRSVSQDLKRISGICDVYDNLTTQTRTPIS